LHLATGIAGCQQLRLRRLNVSELFRQHARRQIRLQEIVNAGALCCLRQIYDLSSVEVFSKIE